MTNDKEELKPCPFCGGKAEMIYWRIQGREVMQEGRVSCKNDCNTMYGKTWSDIRTDKRHETSNEERAITAWNTRPLKEGWKLDDPVEELYDRIEALLPSDFDGGLSVSGGNVITIELSSPPLPKEETT